MENYAFGALCRVGRRRPQWIPTLAKALPGVGPGHLRRPELPGVRQPPPRALLRDGVRHPARGVRRGAQPDPRASSRTPGCSSASRSRCASPPPTTSRCRPASGRRVVLHRRPRLRGHGVPALLRGRRADHGRLRRPAPLGQAPLPDGRDAGAALRPSGTGSRRCATASIPSGASPTPTWTGCWAPDGARAAVSWPAAATASVLRGPPADAAPALPRLRRDRRRRAEPGDLDDVDVGRGTGPASRVEDHAGRRPAVRPTSSIR